MNYKFFLLSVFLLIVHFNAISQEEILALRKIKTPSFIIQFDYNQNGHVTSETKVVFDVDYLSYKFEYEYNENGSIALLKKYDKNSEVWNFTHYEENEYNANNQIVTKNTYKDYGSGFRFTEQQFYTYQDAFLKTITYQNISPEGSNNNIKKDFFYNNEQRLFQIKKYAWINNSWMHIEIFDFEYDNFGNILTYSNEFLMGDDFIKNWRYRFTYNGSSELTERAYYLSGGSEWSPRPLNKYSYQSNYILGTQAVLYPSIYQFDVLNFNWFQHDGSLLIQDDYWLADCDATLHFIESASYFYEPFCLGVENYENHKILIYPNPVTNELRIKNYELKIVNVAIFDIYGKNVFTSPASLWSQEATINISHLKPGTYFVRTATEKGMVTQKIMKQ